MLLTIMRNRMGLVKQIFLILCVLTSNIIISQNTQKISNEQKSKLVNTIGVYCLQMSINQAKGDSIKVHNKYVTLEGFKEKEEKEFTPKSKTEALYKEFVKFRDDGTLIEISYFEEGIFNDKKYLEFNDFFSKNDRISIYKNDLQSLKLLAELKVDTNQEEVENPKDIVSEKTKKIVKTEVKAADKKSGLATKYVVLIAICCFILGVFVHVFITALSNKKAKNKTSNSNYLTIQEPLVDKIKIDSEITELHKKIKALKQENTSLKASIETKTSKDLKQNIDAIKQENKQTIVESPKRIEHTLIYFYAPENGVFTAIAKQKDAVYSLQKIDEYHASFELDINDKNLISTLIFSMDEYINCGCVCENSPNKDTKDIRVLEKGEASKTANGWSITKKCKIQFI